ncbi:hypothetical protein JW906_04170 [bacterium]|nr:hypothetical protein [bacterium]
MAEFLEVEPGRQESKIDFGKDIKADSTKIKDFFIYVTDESIIVRNAVIRSGFVYVTMKNNTKYSIEMRIEFLDLKNESGPLSSTKVLSPDSSLKETFDLAGVNFSPKSSAEGMTVTYKTTSTVHSGSQTDTKSVDLDIDFSKLMLSEVTGWMVGKSIPIDPVESDVNLPAELEGIQFDALTMLVDLDYSPEMPATLDMKIQGINERGEKKEIPINKSLEHGKNSFLIEGLEKVINIFPETIRITGSVILNGDTTFTVSNTDNVKGKFLLEVPLVFSVPQRTFNPMKVDTVDMDEDAQDRLKTNIKEAHLIAEVKNRLPFGFSLQILFSNTIGDSVLYEPGKAAVTKTLEITACHTRQAGPYLEAYDPPTESTLDFGISEADLRVLGKSPLFMGMKFIFPATGGLVKIDPSDYVTLYGRIEGTFNTTVPEDEEGGES